LRRRLLRAGGKLLALVLTVTAAGAAGATEVGEVHLVSAADPGMTTSQALGISRGGGASQDGRYVVFTSSAPNLVPGQSDGNVKNDVFVRDRVTGTTQLVSRSFGAATTAANDVSYEPSISADGRWIAFTSRASNLVAGQTQDSWTDIHLFDRMTGTTVLVSKAAGGSTGANGSSVDPVVSADGNYVLFLSYATDLVAGQIDPGNRNDVFLYDRVADTLTMVSHAAASATTAGDGTCYFGSVPSADGRWVAFTCTSTDLVPGQTDTNGDGDVFLYDRVSGTTTLVSRTATSPSTTGDGDSHAPRLSADGRYLVFSSYATDLVSGQVDDDPWTEDVFLYDRVAGTTVLVSRTTAPGGQTSAGGSYPSLSADGNWIAFGSTGTSLIAGQVDLLEDSNDLFLYERTTGTVTLVSHFPESTTETGWGHSGLPEISDDGGWIAFVSSSSIIVPGQTDTGNSDVFLYERATQTVRLASRTLASPTTAAAGNWLSFDGLSGDGSAVVFSSPVATLAAQDLNGGDDAFIYDRATGTVTALSITPPVTKRTGNGYSWGGFTSADGRWIAFGSRATNLVAGQNDANGGLDVFLYDRVTGTRTLVSRAAGSPATSGNRDSGNSFISADGGWIAFSSRADNLVPGMTSPLLTYQAYLYERATGEITLVSRRIGSPTYGATGSTLEGPFPSADGRFITWSTSAPDLVSGVNDGNNGYDIYLYDRVTATTTLVSRSGSSAMTAGNGSSQNPWISADGRYIVFRSEATDLVPGQTDMNGPGLAGTDIFLYDRVTCSTTLVSRSASSPATTGNADSLDGYPSADGRYVYFGSNATDLVAGQVDTNDTGDFFLYDRETGATTLVSHASGSAVTAGNGFSGGYFPSADGRWIPYMSYATDLVSGVTDTNGAPDLFLHDRSTGTATLVSRSSGSPSVTASGSSGFGLISADGGRVAFYSDAPDLVPGQEDANVTFDVFLYDRATGGMTLASRTSGSPDRTGNGPSNLRWLSADGRTVAFTSSASDLTPDDWNDETDVFLFKTIPPSSFFTLAPCRLLDTRQPQDGPALASGATATLNLHGVCGIPETAKAVAVNITVTQPTASGHLTLSTGDAPVPAVSTINFGAGQTRANNAVLRLAGNATGRLAARAFLLDGGTVHLLLDVTGYFE
jgi:Tol biopolymer transport system component